MEPTLESVLDTHFNHPLEHQEFISLLQIQPAAFRADMLRQI